MSEQLNPKENPNDQLSTGLQVLSFCIPLAGAIIYFSNKSDSPNKAKKACHAALWGIGLGIVLQIIATVAGAGS
ncbi:hypothetical protein [Winogradskyella undariae]|uniref:hypothetical protein n=1 Tax=Winogradskyella undariae TaxID=1285465 RepID=UPI0015CCBA93|nr:hypothetical protein [Winogradskyella undariae]QNK77759.1 hypothetical protein H7F37_01320 [Winogradskyella sp. PAMC22761]